MCFFHIKDPGLFAEQLAVKVEEARVVLEEKEKSHATELRAKDEALNSMTSLIETHNRTISTLQAEMNAKAAVSEGILQNHKKEIEAKNAIIAEKEQQLQARIPESGDIQSKHQV